MPTGKKFVSVLVEPGYDKLIDCNYCLRGICDMAERLEISVKIYAPFEKNSGYPEKLSSQVILLSATASWAASVSDDLHRRNIEVIQMPCNPTVADPRNHTIGEDYLGFTNEIYRYLEAGGKHRVALIGFNNTMLDKRRINGFLRSKATFDYRIEFEQLPSDTDFAEIPGKFDTVILNNGINAASFVMWANENGVRIPEELWVISMQATHITRILSPSITTVKTIDYFHAGELALNLATMLSSMRVHGQVIIRHAYELIVRESTAGFKPDTDMQKSSSSRTEHQKFLLKNDTRTSLCCDIENKLFCLDDTELDILHGILLRTTTERIAEHVNMSSSTVNYHIKTILSLFHVDSRQELIRLFRDNHMLGIADLAK